MYLSYSGYKTYKDCPRKYWHRYVNKSALPSPENRVNSLYGSVVGALFEDFYNLGIFRQSGVEKLLVDRVPATMARVIKEESRDGTIDFSVEWSNYPSREALEKDVLATIPRGLGIIRAHRLVSRTVAEAEVRLDSQVGRHKLGGRTDFIIERVDPHCDRVLLDGKGSRWRDKYVDVDQLLWYAFLHQEKYRGRLPDKLGFLYWRCEADNSLDWVEFDDQRVKDLRYAAVSTADTIEGDVGRSVGGGYRLFPAVVDKQRCKLCAYLAVCTEGSTYSQADVPGLVGTSGIEDVGLGI
jgi:hypothetical protein